MINVLLVILVGFTIWQLAAFRPWQPEPQANPALLACTTTVSGTITENVTWQAAGSPVCLSATTTVGRYAILTIEPGVIVQAQNSAALVIEGRLNAAGTAEQAIYFDSESGTAPGQWVGLVFDGYYGVGKGILSHVNINHGGAAYYGSNANLILQNGAQVVVTDSQILTSAGHGVLVTDDPSRLEFTNNWVTNNAAYPLVLPPDDAALASGNSFIGNTPNRVRIDSEDPLQLHADGTWRSSNGSGEYELDRETIVKNGATLTLEPGVTIFAPAAAYLLVEGELEAIGTDSQPVTLTSTADSGPGQWVGLVFDGSSSFSRGSLAYVTIRNGGLLYYGVQGNVIIESADVSMDHCIVTASAGNGVWVDEKSTIAFENNTVTNSGGYGMVVYLHHLSTILNNSFSFNTPNRILIQPGTFDAP